MSNRSPINFLIAYFRSQYLLILSRFLKKCVARLSRLTTHFATNMINIRIYCEQKYAVYEICYSRHLLPVLVHCKLIHIGNNCQKSPGLDFIKTDQGLIQNFEKFQIAVKPAILQLQLEMLCEQRGLAPTP